MNIKSLAPLFLFSFAACGCLSDSSRELKRNDSLKYFSYFDANNDGYISRDEWRRRIDEDKSISTSPGNAVSGLRDNTEFIFSKLDSDNDEKLTTEEYCREWLSGKIIC